MLIVVKIRQGHLKQSCIDRSLLSQRIFLASLCAVHGVITALSLDSLCLYIFIVQPAIFTSVYCQFLRANALATKRCQFHSPVLCLM